MLRTDLELVAEGEGLEPPELGVSMTDDEKEIEESESGETMALIKDLAVRVRGERRTEDAEPEVRE